jgi:hypothetical protein
VRLLSTTAHHVLADTGKNCWRRPQSHAPDCFRCSTTVDVLEPVELVELGIALPEGLHDASPRASIAAMASADPAFLPRIEIRWTCRLTGVTRSTLPVA